MDIRTRNFRVLSLCTGGYGLDLGLELAVQNARTVCAVEIEAFAIKKLVEKIKKGTISPFPIYSNVKTFNAKPWLGKVDCVIGGYPCQPFSIAGKQKGKDDPRHLWPDVARIVAECKPSVCFFENVGGHLRLGFEQVHDDLQAMGYEVKTGLFTAEEVGAPHKRERQFIMGYTQSLRNSRRLPIQGRVEKEIGGIWCDTLEGSSKAQLADTNGSRFQMSRSEQQTTRCTRNGGKELADLCSSRQCTGCNHWQERQVLYNQNRNAKETEQEWQGRVCRLRATSSNVADGDNERKQIQITGEEPSKQMPSGTSDTWRPFPPKPNEETQWSTVGANFKPSVHRMADGLADRVDEIRMHGNGVVPLQAAHAFLTLWDMIDK